MSDIGDSPSPRSHNNEDQFQKTSSVGKVGNRWIDTLNRLARKDVISKERFKAVLHEKMVKRESCFSLPFTVIFFVFYMMMVLAHEDVYTTYRTEKAIRNLVESVSCEGAEYKLTDAIVPLDVWRWFESSIVCKDSEWFQQLDMQGKPLPRKEWARVLGTNRLYGGVLLEQSRTQRTECGVDLPFAWDCYPKERERVPDVSTFGLWHSNQSVLPQAYAEKLHFDNEGFEPLNLKILDDQPRRLGIGGRPEYPINERIFDLKMHVAEEAYPFFFLEQESLANLSTRLRYLQEGAWIDEQTELITMKAILVNAEVKLITRVTIIFRFGMPGGIDVAVRLQSSPMEFYKGTMGPVFDGVWLFMLCSIFSSLVKDFRSAKNRGEFKGYIQSLWTWIDVLTVFFGFAIILGFAIQREANELLVSAMDVVDFNRAIDQEYLRELYQVHKLADSIAKGTMWYRILLGDYVLLLMLRFFKAYRAQPRLALVTNAITAAAADLLHFGIVFMSIFMSFAYASVILFGRRLEGFSSFWQSVATCWAIICGDLSWKEISIEHPVTAAVWFCSFMLLVYFVLLNMVLAVVMDVYTEVRAHTIVGDTLWVQCGKACKTIWHQGVRETYRSQKEDSELISKLDQLGDEISKTDILTICPMKGGEQVDDLFSAARAIESKQESRGLSIVDAVKEIGQISEEVSQIRDMVWQHTNSKCWRHIHRNVTLQVKARSRRALKAQHALIGALQSGELNSVLYDLRKSQPWKKNTRPQSARPTISTASSRSHSVEPSSRSNSKEVLKKTQSPGGSRRNSLSGSGIVAETGSLACMAPVESAQEFTNRLKNSLSGSGIVAEPVVADDSPTGRGKAEKDKACQDALAVDILASLTSAVREAVRSEFKIQTQAFQKEAHDWAGQLKSSVCKDMREMFKLREVRKTKERTNSKSPRHGNNEGKTDKATACQTPCSSLPAKTTGESGGMDKQCARPSAATDSLQSGRAVVTPVQGKVAVDVDVDATRPSPNNARVHARSSSKHCSTHTPESLGKQMLVLAGSRRGSKADHHRAEAMDIHESKSAEMPVPGGIPMEVETPRVNEALESSHPNMAARHCGAAMQKQHDSTETITPRSAQCDAVGSPPTSASSSARTVSHAPAKPSTIAQGGLNDDRLQVHNGGNDVMYDPSSLNQAVSCEGLGRRESKQSRCQPSSSSDPMMQAPNWHPHYNSGMNDEAQQIVEIDENLQFTTPRMDRINGAGIPQASAPQHGQEQLILVSHAMHRPDEQYVLAPQQLVRSRSRPNTANSYVPHNVAQQQFVGSRPQTARRHAPFMPDGTANALPDRVYQTGPLAPCFVSIPVQRGDADLLI